MKMRTIAIDDEPLALSLVSGYIKKTGFLDLIAVFDNPIDAIDFLQEEVVDLVFLDIQMPELNGVEFVKTLLKPPKIIFTTAFEKYALEGFKLNAIDYLLKPFSYTEFLISVNKAIKIFEFENSAKEGDSNAEYLFLKSEYKIRKVSYNDILYVEGLKDYVKVFLQSDELPVLSISTIKSMESKLPSKRFMRVHRSFIVNLEKIEVVERSRIIFGEKHIPVGDHYKTQFQKFIKRNYL